VNGPVTIATLVVPYANVVQHAAVCLPERLDPVAGYTEAQRFPQQAHHQEVGPHRSAC
jgi:hypothetical protein